MGFYKLDGTSILTGNIIFTSTATLVAEDKNSFTYPQDGWYWFDTEEEAYSFFNIKKEV